MPQSSPGDADDRRYQFYRPAEALRSANDPLVATLDGRNIYLSAVGDAYAELPDDSKRQAFDLTYPVLLEGLISQQALVLQAQREHLDQDPEVIRRIQHVIDLALANEVLTRAVAKSVTDQAIHDRYQRDYAGRSSKEEIHLRVIVVRTQADAEHVLASLANGEDFAKLAQRVSIDPSGVNGGDIGFAEPEQLAPNIAEAVVRQPTGTVSPRPLLDRQAWEIFRVEQRRTVPVPTFDQAKDAIHQQLVQEVIRQEAEKARSKVQIKAYNVDGTALESPDQSLLDQQFNFTAIPAKSK